jgi:uncharacterized OB-fold protein
VTALVVSTMELPISPSPDAAPFWEAAGRGELVLPRCGACANVFWYPRAICPSCGSRDVGWMPASGRGEVHAFCIHHSSPLPHLRGQTPIVTALVELDEGVRMMAFLDVDPDPGAVRCGMRVAVELRPTAGDARVPVFVPTQEDP